ncbi:hypothetical protein [Paenibacillus xanthanilyticus]|uniref:Uncharacterized protein n=1 Tax=Paenibacillus xanthanilyticus TaxID=1783531 RepID=A0ABV8K6R2_9BACL
MIEPQVQKTYYLETHRSTKRGDQDENASANTRKVPGIILYGILNCRTMTTKYGLSNRVNIYISSHSQEIGTEESARFRAG